MFKRIIEYLRGVLEKMFKRDTLKTVVGAKITLSNEMIQKIESWDKMLKGKAEWIGSDIVSMRLEQAICKEFTNVAISEMESGVSDEILDELYQKAIVRLNEEMQTGLALGAFAIKPLGATGEVEYIPADRIIPIEYNSDGKLTKCAFVQIKPSGERDIYYRIEIHEHQNEGLHIVNKAYLGDNSTIGHEISLESVEEWASLMPEVFYPGMDRMDFGFYRNPIPNHIDGSYNGISVYENAVEQIKRADFQYSRLEWEFESAERAVFADYTAVMKTGNGNSFELPKNKRRLFIGINPEADKGLQEHSPTIREQNFINGLNEYLRKVEFNSGLAYGDLSKNETVEKTATEIRISKQRKYNAVNAIQKNLKQCLEDLVYAIAFYQAKYLSAFEFNCVFHDSILTDEKEERAQDRIDMQMGIMSKLEYRMKWYGEDEATAAKNISMTDLESGSEEGTA